MSLVFIFLAALFDRFDGMTARYFHIESMFGKELDSLSDIIAVGVAPALLIYHTALAEMLWVDIEATIIYIACGAIRLARYNVEEFDGVFRGLPITAAGLLLTALYFTVPYIDSAYLIIAMLFLSWAMAGKVRISKV